MRTEYFSIMNQKRNNKKHKTGSDNFKLNEVKVIDWLTVQANTTVHSAPARLQWRGELQFQVIGLSFDVGNGSLVSKVGNLHWRHVLRGTGPSLLLLALCEG